MDHPQEERVTVTRPGEILLHIQRQITRVNNTESGDGNTVNTRGIIIAICLLILAIVVVIVILVQYYRHGHCFQKPRLIFGQNIIRDLKSIQLEFDPPFTISGMMNTVGNQNSDQQFQYRNMRTREEDLYPTIEEHH
ncbi:small integral membrane protein 35-like [Heterodontus francisci]|uniref:small integral membrane protein 35-like n=1 Tax=Heterodontus francisci TaxID=7792 RepID=UPI00355B6863